MPEGHAMQAMPTTKSRASLEALVESGLLRLESLHPGGLETARELAELCRVEGGTRVLDVASGTGETACYLTEQFGARVVAIDASGEMIRRGEAKARGKGLNIEFETADAAHLPFADSIFDVAICECTLCLLDKEKVVNEMARVVRPQGYVGMHDLCWQENAPEDLKRTLAQIEGERPESLDGWQRLFRSAGLVEVRAKDKFELMAHWMRESRRQLGMWGELALAWQILRRWGLSGLRTVMKSERVFSSRHLGYGIVVGMKR
jgi:SAM-dependent methyltransferase